MSWHDGGKESRTWVEFGAMLLGYVAATTLVLGPIYIATRDELEVVFLRTFEDWWSQSTQPAFPAAPSHPVPEPASVEPPPPVPPPIEPTTEKPRFRPRAETPTDYQLDETAELNLKELSKYAVKTGTAVVDGKLVDVWKSKTYDQTYFPPHRGV